MPLSENPIIVAGVIVQEGKVLMVQNIKYGLRVEVPGGKLEPGEELRDAVRREIMEELGVGVTVQECIGVYPTDMTKEGQFDVHLFACAITEGQPVGDREPTKLGGFAWMTVEEMEACRELVPSMRAALGDVRRLIAGVEVTGE